MNFITAILHKEHSLFSPGQCEKIEKENLTCMGDVFN